MKNSSHKASSLTRIMRGLFISAFIMAMMGLSTQARAVTAAGTVIQNQALVEYTDEQGNAQEARSNWARISVKQIYSATIAVDIPDLKAGSNQTVYFQHILTNTGNGVDTYTINVSQNDSAAGDDGNFVVLSVFHDINSNGQIEAGEDDVNGQTIDLEASEFASLVIEAQLPTGLDGDYYDLTLTTTAASGVDVDDLSDRDNNGTIDQGLDTLDNTNEDRVTITTDAALNVNKSYTHVPPTYTWNGDNSVTVNPGTITYTITVTNTGLKDAKSVVVWDGVPYNTFEGTVALVNMEGFGDGSGGFDAVDTADRDIRTGTVGTTAGNGEENLDCGTEAPFTQTTGGAQGGCILGGSGSVAAVAGASDENTLNLDMNNDGDTGDNDRVIVYGYDDVLPANSTISFSYSVQYNNHRVGEHEATPGPGTSYDSSGDGNDDTVIAPGDLIPNTAYVSASLDGNDVPESVEESNEVLVEVPAYPGVAALDTNQAASIADASTIDAANDGGDDDGDGTGNTFADDLPDEDSSQEGNITNSADNQFVMKAATSMVVDFEHIIVNLGNDTDTFDLTIDEAGSTFPAGTEFTFFDSTGKNPLLDTDLDGIVDTGPMAPSGILEITVFAHLPDTISHDDICTDHGDTAGGAGGPGIKLQQNGTPADTSDDFYFYDATDDCEFAGDREGDSDYDAADIADGVFAEDDYFKYELTAKSSLRRSDNNAFDADTTDGRLGAVYVPGVDLSNGATQPGNTTNTTDNAVDGDPTANDDGVDFTTNAAGGGLRPSVSQMNSVNVGETTTFELLIVNDSDQEDTFQIFAGRGINTTDILDGDPSTLVTEADMMAMWPGWNVVFTDSATPGQGNVITGTPSISDSETYTVYAHVTTSPDVSESRADLYNDGTTNPLTVDIDNDDGNNNPFDGDVTADADNTAGTVEKLDVNGDGRGEYPIFFLIVSSNTNAYDVKLDAVQLNEQEDVILVYDNEGQVQPGGSIDYPHVLKNVGNTDETFELTDRTDITAVQGQGNSATDWSNVFYVYVDADGDCTDTANRDWIPWTLLEDGDAVVINENYETTTTGTDCEDYDASGGAGAAWTAAGDGLKLRPDEELYIKVRVFSPSSAPNGEQDYLTITAAYDIQNATNYDTEGTVNVDRTTVILGQLRVYKTVAPDVDCNDDGAGSAGDPDGAVTFEEAHSTLIEPSDCVVWQLLVVNEGDTDADDVVVYDSAPDFSAIVDSDYTSADLLTGAAGKPALDDDATESYFLRSCKLDGAVAVDDSLNTANNVTCLDTNGIEHADHRHAFTSANAAGGIGITNADTPVAFAKSDLNGNVTFYIGAGATNSAGGTLKPGEAWLIRFSTQVE